MDFEQMVNAMRDKLDDATKGKVSEDLIAILGEYRSHKQTLEDAQASNNKLTAAHEELLICNARFFQQIGFNNTQDKVTFNGEQPSKKEPTLKIEDIIYSKRNISKKYRRLPL